MPHPYERSPHSNAGNCTCGMAEESSVHPHAYAQALRSNVCVCALAANHPVHIDADTAVPDPNYAAGRSNERGAEAVRAAVRQARGCEAAPQVPITFA